MKKILLTALPLALMLGACTQDTVKDDKSESVAEVGLSQEELADLMSEEMNSITENDGYYLENSQFTYELENHTTHILINGVMNKNDIENSKLNYTLTTYDDSEDLEDRTIILNGEEFELTFTDNDFFIKSKENGTLKMPRIESFLSLAYTQEDNDESDFLNVKYELNGKEYEDLRLVEDEYWVNLAPFIEDYAFSFIPGEILYTTLDNNRMLLEMNDELEIKFEKNNGQEIYHITEKDKEDMFSEVTIVLENDKVVEVEDSLHFASSNSDEPTFLYKEKITVKENK